MSELDVRAVMGSLKGFQRDAVDHVMERFHGADSTAASGRFLIADETGLGKSIVAKGVVARTIEQLECARIPRIDIVYICSNADLATQNLRRLNVTGERQLEMTTRLTLLAKKSKQLNEGTQVGRSKVNLVSFTPGTSFSGGGWRQGSAEERAMLVLLLEAFTNPTPAQRRATDMLFRGTVQSAKHFRTAYVANLHAELGGEPDQVIACAFQKDIESTGALERFLELRDEMRGLSKIPTETWGRVQNSIAELRTSLAKAGVDTLEPDLVILDEFQRFRHLLDPESGDAGELAHALYQHPGTKVLLLSATPYKPFTNAEDDGEDHSTDFLATIKFLAGGAEGAELPVASALEGYRTALTGGEDATDAADLVRRRLLPLMSRSERPPIAERDDLVQVRYLGTTDPTAEDVRDWVTLRRLGHEVDAPIDLEYWKSIPYFANFMDGYKPAHRIRAALEDGADVPRAARVADALGATRTLDADAIRRFDPVDLGNSHLRALAAETVDNGWWKLLWVPPTMPYVEPGPVFEPLSDGSVTKQVIFSAWTGVPAAVSGLLSYEADRRAAGDRSLLGENSAEGRRAVLTRRLAYRLVDGERAAAMSTLALFWPHPALAVLGDQLAAAHATSGRVTPESLLARIGDQLPAASAVHASDAYFGYPGALPEALRSANARSLVLGMNDEASEDGTDGGDGTDSSAPEAGAKGFTLHVEAALERIRGGHPEGVGHHDLARLAAFAPGNSAYGAVASVAGPEATDAGIWSAAFALADGIRSLFNRPESIALLDTLYGDRAESGEAETQWRRVLDYCADGNLRAVLDEYLFQLLGETGGGDIDDAGLLELVKTAVEAISLRPARYVAHDTTPERHPIPLTARFALRYGGKQVSDSDSKDGVRQGEVRGSFNSPFAPFVLASTSVGQEGIDFHWWSHSVVHWNLPSNPVDFEQREGRVNRFAGHAVRKNVAAAHWKDALASRDARVWRAAFAAAEQTDHGLGEFSPWWMYPGPARIHRVIAQYPLSRDALKYERLKRALTLYRLTLGQPRQEDMLELLAQRDADAGKLPTIDLRPPGA